MRASPLDDPRRARIASACLLALAAALVYANALANGFAVDDRVVVLENPLVHSLSGLWRAWSATWWASPPGLYRPFVLCTYVVDWAVSGGHPAWFHAVNVLWHVAATLAVWALLGELLAPTGALAGALLFAVHPVHVEAVANTVGRAELAAATFVVVALLAHRRARWWGALAFALALASKESAIVFLALAAANDLLLAPEGPRAALRARRRCWVAYAVVASVYLATLAAIFRGARMNSVATLWTGVSAGDRLLSVVGFVPDYLRLLVAPFSLSAEYGPDVMRVAHGITPAVVLGAVLLACWVAGVALAWRRAPVVAFGLLFIPVAFSPVANVAFPSGVVLAERTFYLPSVGAVLLAGALVARLRRPALGMAAVAALSAAFVVRTWTRTPAWRDGRSAVLTLVREHPESYSGHQSLGRAFLEMGNLPAGRDEFAIARRIFRLDPGLYRESAELEAHAGDLARARAFFDTALVLDPRHAPTLLRRADVRFLAGDYAGAAADARAAAGLAPDSTRAVIVLAAASWRAGDAPSAMGAYRDGIARHPAAWDLRAGHAVLLDAQGDRAAAAAEAERALALSGGNALTRALHHRLTSPR